MLGTIYYITFCQCISPDTICKRLISAHFAGKAAPAENLDREFPISIMIVRWNVVCELVAGTCMGRNHSYGKTD